MSGRIKIWRVAIYLNPWCLRRTRAPPTQNVSTCFISWKWHFLQNAPDTKKPFFRTSRGHGLCLGSLSSIPKGSMAGIVFFLHRGGNELETVRNLNRMPPLLLRIRNLCSQGKAPREVMESIDEINDILKEVLQEHRK